jgi:Lon protease-like protein
MKEKKKILENVTFVDNTDGGSDDLSSFSYSPFSSEDLKIIVAQETDENEVQSGDSLDGIPGFSLVEEGYTVPLTKQWSLDKSMNSLIQLYKLFGGSVRSAELRSFVDRYSNQILGETKEGPGPHPSSFIKVDPFSCPGCYNVWVEPVTIPCGHSYCRKCLIKLVAGETCRKCTYEVTNSDIYHTKIDVIMAAVVEKFWPKSMKTSLLRDEGNRLFDRRILEDSFWKYSEALRLSPDDHMSWANRSHVQLVLGRTEAALVDAETSIGLCPVWPKGYFRKGSALIKSEVFDDAFVDLTLCLYIIKSSQTTDMGALRPVQNELSRVVHKIFLSSSGGVCPGIFSLRRHSVDQLLFAPYPSPRLRSPVERLSGDTSESETCYSSGDELENSRDSACGRTREKFNSKSLPFLPTRGGGVTLSTFDSSCHDFVIRTRQLFDKTQRALTNIRETVARMERGECTLRPVQAAVSVENLECSLCYRLFYEPVVTPCGHTYCRTCLERSLDHSSDCPLCKTSLFDTLARRRFQVTEFMDKVILQFLPTERAERMAQHSEEIAEAATPSRSNEIELPIFVCTMAFPGVACPLHVFEPRYRLMIRRSMESGSRKFGMCCYLQDAEGNYANYGTLLEVTSVQYFPDGRSVIDTVGVRRFKILKKSMKDGYNTATIEYLIDRAVPRDDRQRLIDTHKKVYSVAGAWLDSINQVLKQRIMTHFGNIPEPEDNWMEIPDGPSWIWWLLAILPLDSKAQLAILSMDSLQKRLDSILKVLNYVKSTNV